MYAFLEFHDLVWWEISCVDHEILFCEVFLVIDFNKGFMWNVQLILLTRNNTKPLPSKPQIIILLNALYISLRITITRNTTLLLPPNFKFLKLTTPPIKRKQPLPHNTIFHSKNYLKHFNSTKLTHNPRNHPNNPSGTTRLNLIRLRTFRKQTSIARTTFIAINR